MSNKLSFIQDTVGNNYIGIVVPYSKVTNFLDKMYELIPDDYSKYLGNQQRRDHGQYHITILNVAECNMLSNKMGIDKFTQRIEHLTEVSVDDIQYYGLGSASKNENTAFYIIVKSTTLEEIRKSLGLQPKDFHVTIGFNWKDVHGVDKGTSTLVEKKSPFIEIISESFG